MVSATRAIPIEVPAKCDAYAIYRNEHGLSTMPAIDVPAKCDAYAISLVF